MLLVEAEMEWSDKLTQLGLWLDAVAHDGCWNMAVDEMLLSCATMPVLRVYGWSRREASVGIRFDLEQLPEEMDVVPVVKRPTGGGIVWHGVDQTFTLVVPDDPAFQRFNPRHSYRWIHERLAACLKVTTGQPHHLVPSDSGSVGDVCFTSPVASDVMCEGRKVAGGAQRRTKTGFLHQGSIQANALPLSFWSGLAEALADEVIDWCPDQAHEKWTERRAEERRLSSAWHRPVVS